MGASPNPLFDMSKATPIVSAGAAPLFDMSKAQPIAGRSSSEPPADYLTHAEDIIHESAQTLGREVSTAGRTIAGIPGAIYHAFSDPETDEERAQRQAIESAGGNVPNDFLSRAIFRLSGAGQTKEAINFYTRYAKASSDEKRIMEDAMLQVAPEALGIGAGAVLAPKIIENAPAAVRTAASAGPPVIRGAGRTYNAVQSAGQVVAPVAGIAESFARLAQGDVPGAVYSALGGGMIGRVLEKLPRAPESVTNFGRPQPTYPGAPLPEVPSPELLQAGALTQPGTAPAPEPSAGLGQIPLRAEVKPAPTPAEAQPVAPTPYNRAMMPVHGESALADILTRLDQQTLLRIAKSRGISVTQEAQLKAGIANPRLVQKIVDDFSPEELDEVGAKYLDSERFRHQYGPGLSDEAWTTMTLNYFFPDVKIPAAMAKRAAASMAVNASQLNAAGSDLTGILQESLARAKTRK